MFLHDYLLACEIPTVRTQTLKRDDISSGIEINSCMFGFALSSGLSIGIDLSLRWPLGIGSTVWVTLY